MKVYVRALKDKSALEHVNEKYYGNHLELRTLGGARGEILAKEIESLPKDDFSIVLLGRESSGHASEEMSSATKKVHFTSKEKIRNLRMNQLYYLIEEAKARFVLDVRCLGDRYVLGKPTNFLGEISLGSDVFLVLWEKYKSLLEEHIRVNNYPLVLHKGDLDEIFARSSLVGRVKRPLDGRCSFESLVDGSELDLDLEGTMRANDSYLEEKLEVTLEKLRRVAKQFDEIVVPWSGGKDSTAVILLAKKLNLKFTAIVVDTGLEFPETLEYVERVAKALGVRKHVEYAGVDVEYRSEGEEYLKSRRCTRRKISSLYACIRRNFEKPLILVGDRISESAARSLRPELKQDEGFWLYAPIRYWSYLDVQMLLRREGVEFNPLYSYGFYRIGCYVCPFVDAFEKYVLEKLSLLSRPPS